MTLDRPAITGRFLGAGIDLSRVRGERVVVVTLELPLSQAGRMLDQATAIAKGADVVVTIRPADPDDREDRG